MKYCLIVVLIVLSLAVGAACAQAPDLERMDLVLKSVPDGPVARVNGESIGAAAFRNLYTTELMRFSAMRGGPIHAADRISVAMQCLTVLIEREILHQQAVNQGLVISDEEVEKEWAGEVETLGKAFAQEGAGPLSESQVLARLGISREKAIQHLRSTLLADQMRRRILKDKGVTVSDKEVRAFFDENRDMFRRPATARIKQIFIRADQGKQSEARQRAETARRRVLAGQSFDLVAREMSDSADAGQGGDLGAMPVDAYPSFYREAIESMDPGDLSDVIESEHGYHIITLVEHILGSDADFGKVKEAIHRELEQRKSDRAIDEYCAEVSDEQHIETFLQLDRTIATHPQRAEIVKRPGGIEQ